MCTDYAIMQMLDRLCVQIGCVMLLKQGTSQAPFAHALMHAVQCMQEVSAGQPAALQTQRCKSARQCRKQITPVAKDAGRRLDAR